MEPTLPERLLWTAVVGFATAAAVILTRRSLAWAWERVRGTAPPHPIGVLEALAHKAGESQFRRRG